MKMTKRERAAYKLGKREGYNEGYIKGLYDGNPFNKLAEACSNMLKVINERLKDPEFVKMAKELAAVDTDARERFEGKCPYTGKECEDWRCGICEVEERERRWLEEDEREDSDDE